MSDVKKSTTVNIPGGEHGRAFVANALSLTRQNIFSNLFDPRRNINQECGYPDIISMEEYRTLYDREGIATRVVATFPEESWSVDPDIKEDEDPKDTDFEDAWKKLQDEQNIYHYMHRIDELSGIGAFGVILLGFDDGGKLNEAVPGINEKGEKEGEAKNVLIYLRVFDESVVTIKTHQNDVTNPRFGLPLTYDIKFESVDSTAAGGSTNLTTTNVHWSRLIHVADNRKMSEILGVPRIQTVYNRIYDLRKVLSGSGEMFWKGGFPGIALEVSAENSDVEIDEDATKEVMDDYMNGLQRYIALQGMTAKSLAPQVADPTGHVKAQLQIIAISLSIPTRIMFGSEEAKLASTQDAKTWNKRVARRQNKYLSPMLIRPFIDRLIALGSLPEPKEEGYTIEWPDLNMPTDEDKAKVAEIKTKTLAQYVKGDISQLMAPEEFFKIIMEMDPDVIEQIMDSLEKFMKEELEEGDDIPPALPVPEPTEEV